MRITSGILRNRRFNAPKQDVRPTKESVREAIFSSLGGRCDGLRVLDLCAGAGGLGLEAWSRGAESVTFVELNGAVFQNLKKNVATLGGDDQLGEVRLVKSDFVRFLERAGAGQYDLILVDPPYDLPDAFEKALNGIREADMLAEGGILIYELRSKSSFEVQEDWTIVREKKYGVARVLTLRLGE